MDLIEYLIKLTTREGQIVLDPFIGSGTTALAAKALNRNYIGFEMNQEYCGKKTCATFLAKFRAFQAFPAYP